MKKILIIIVSLALAAGKGNAQECLSGNCSNFGIQYPSGTFSTTSSSWPTVSSFMNASNWTLFSVTSGSTYEWTYCSTYGGVENWDAELTLWNYSNGQYLCFSDDASSCGTAPYISWQANFTGTVGLLTSQYPCAGNSGSPYNKLVWRQASGAACSGTPSFRLTSPISVSPNPIPYGNTVTVTATMQNMGTSSGPYDFECDLEDLSGGYVTVIGKCCSRTIAPGASATNLSINCQDVNSILTTCGNYRISIYALCSVCNNCGISSCPKGAIAPNGYTLPYPISVTGCCTALTNYNLTNQTVTVTAPMSASFNITTGGSTPFYQWQYSIDGGSSWNPVPSTSPYSGMTTPTLTINPTSAPMNGYMYRCYMSNSCSSGYTNWGTLIVNSPCPSSVIANSNTPVSPGGTLNLTATSIAGASYSWTGPSGWTSASQNPSRTNMNSAMAGNYCVTTSVIGCSNVSNCTSVSMSCPSSVTANSNSPVSPGGTLNLTATSISGAFYTWTGPNGWTSASQNPSRTNMTLTMAGLYCVTASVSGCSNVSNCTSVSMSCPASVTANSNSPVSPGGTLNLTATSIAGASYSWTGPSGWTSASQNPSRTNMNSAMAGNYCVTASVSGCSNVSNCRNVVVSIPPFPDNYVIQQNYPSYHVAEPIDIATGSYEYKYTDFTIPAVNTSLNFIRYYSSVNASVNSTLGYGWSHTYDYYVINQADTLWNVHYGDGHDSYFIPLFNGNGTSFALYGGTYETLYKDPGTGFFSLTFKTGEIYYFNASDKLSSITDLNGNTTNLNYSSGNLTSVVAPGGRTLSLNYSVNRVINISDPLGRNVSFSYDGNGNLIQATNPNSGVTAFSYNVLHLITQITTPRGNILLANSYDGQNRVVAQSGAFGNSTTIAYNSPGVDDATITYPGGSTSIVHHDAYFRLTQETDELGYSKIFSYDGNNNRTSVTDENGNTTNFTYDSKGNRLTITKPTSVTTQISYNSFNKPVNITDPLSNISGLTYNANANLTQINLPNGSSKNFTYYSNGLVHTYTDALGNTTTYNYNSFGDLISVVSPSGTKTFTCDASGRRTSQTDENDHTTSYLYNNNDMVIVVTDPLGSTVQYGFDADDDLISLTDKNGNQSQLTYDSKDRLASIQDAAGGTKTFAYDLRDNVTAITDANGHTMQNGYDAKKRLISKTNFLGTTQYGYDAVGNKISETNPTGNSKTFSYDALNQRTSVADALGNTTAFTYNSLGQITGMQDPLGRNTNYNYNAVGLMTGIIDAAGHSTTATYDANGNRLTITDANNHTQHFSYDASNRLGSYTDASGNIFSFVYDGVGNHITETKPTGTITRIYNALDKVITVVNAGNDTYTYTYDANGNLLTAANNIGTSLFAYDNLNHPVHYTDMFGNNVYYTYDAVGKRTSIQYPGNHLVNYNYDNDNNLTQVTDWLGNSTTYNYDADGKLTGMNYPNGINCNYSYDAAGRLISQSNTIAATIINQSIFTLNANGNRTQENRQGPTPSHLTAASFHYTYGQDDRMISDSLSSFQNDASGNRTGETSGAGTTTYNFSVDNILNSIISPANTTTYHYDANKNRVEKNVAGTVTRYVLDLSSDLSQLLQEQDNNGNVKAHYIYGLGLIARIDSANNILYYHYDAQHNTVALTNASAQIMDTYTYEPFGTLLTHTGNTQQPFTFLGECGVQKETSSIYYIRARYYDATNGRFLSKDSYPANLLNPQTLNRYIYGLNNPISMFDVNGFNISIPEAFDFSNTFRDANRYVQGEIPYSDYLLTFAIDLHELFTIFPGYGTGAAAGDYIMNPTPENYQRYLRSLGLEFIPGGDTPIRLIVESVVNEFIIHNMDTHNIPQNILSTYLNGLNWLGNQLGNGIYNLMHPCNN